MHGWRLVLEKWLWANWKKKPNNGIESYGIEWENEKYDGGGGGRNGTLWTCDDLIRVMENERVQNEYNKSNRIWRQRAVEWEWDGCSGPLGGIKEPSK